MNKSIVKKIIIEKQEEIPSVDLMYREMPLEPTCNYVFVGLRRSGKSYLMFQHIQNLIKTGEHSMEEMLYVNFEDERLAMTKAEELGDILEAYYELYDKRPKIFLDEIQNILGWEKFVRRLADAKYNVFVTGSNAQMLSRDVATTLGGRFVIKEVFSFSFKEYLQKSGVVLTQHWEYQSVKNQVVKLWHNYIQYGGFAESFELNDKRSWLNSLYQKILLGDVITRNQIRNSDAIRLLSKKLAESVMQPTSQTRLQHIVSSSGAKVSRNTIVGYVNNMKDAYLIFGIANYTDTLHERESSQKRYFCDNGLLNIFYTDSENKLLENIVAIALMKRYGIENVFYYNKNVEVDFYIPSTQLAIQVSYSIAHDDTLERETKAIVKLCSAFTVQQAIIITANEEKELKINGITISAIPVWKWMLLE